MQPFERILILVVAIFCLWVIYTSVRNLLKKESNSIIYPPHIDVTIKKDETQQINTNKQNNNE